MNCQIKKVKIWLIRHDIVWLIVLFLHSCEAAGLEVHPPVFYRKGPSEIDKDGQTC